jgi:hypothetical protein
MLLGGVLAKQLIQRKPPWIGLFGSYWAGEITGIAQQTLKTIDYFQ